MHGNGINLVGSWEDYQKAVKDTPKKATFVNGPERPTPRRVKLAAGESTTISQSFLRAITRVRVTLNCHAS